MVDACERTAFGEVEQALLARREVLGCDATVDDGLEPYTVGWERRPGV